MNNQGTPRERPVRDQVKSCLLLFIFLFVCLLFVNGFLTVPLQFILLVCFSWIWFLSRTIPEIQPDYSTVVLGVTAIIFFTFLLTIIVNSLLRNTEKDSSITWSFRSSVIATLLIATGFVAGTAMIGVIHQTTWLLASDKPFLSIGTRNAMYRSSSRNNLKQIGIALHNYHETFGVFPLGNTYNENGKPMHGWLTRILPMVEQPALYDQVDFNVAWDDQANTSVFQQYVQCYLNLGVDKEYHKPRNGYYLSHYAGNLRVIDRSRSTGFEIVTDGTSHTIFGGEINTQFQPWGKPAHLRDPALGINKHPLGFGSPFQGGANMAFVDGRVRFISDQIDPKILAALSTPAGGETIPEDY